MIITLIIKINNIGTFTKLFLDLGTYFTNWKNSQ